MSINHIEIKHLRMLCAISESGNMTRAAENLCISQSALSQQLKDIENKLETSLFFRTRKKMILTAVGQQLKNTAHQVLASVDQAEGAIKQKVGGEKGELKVGTQCIFCYKWLPRVLTDFQVKFPNVEIEVGNATDPLHELEEKTYDLIISGATAPKETHTSVPLFKDQLVCIMPKNHPLVSCSNVKFTDFSEWNLISHAAKGRNRLYLEVLKPKGIVPKKIMNVGAPQAILDLVSAGLGIAVFPRWAVGDALRAGRIEARPIGLRGMPFIWHAVHLIHRAPPMYLQEFIRSISSLEVTSPS